jgi:hypothetical protein
VLVELGVFTLLVRRRDERVTLVLEPFSNAQLVFSGTEEGRLVNGVLKSLVRHLDLSCRTGYCTRRDKEGTHVVKNKQNFHLQARGRS